MGTKVLRPVISAAWAGPLAMGAVAALTLAGAWTLQAAGYVPCDLCLRERIPYELGIAVACVTAIAARSGRTEIVLAGLAALIVTFAASAALGLYHAGVEWGAWPGPTECSGAFATPAKASDFFKQLGTVTVVRCDQPALRVLGLSLAAWNAVISILLTLAAVRSASKAGLSGAG